MALTATEAAKKKFLRTGRGYARREVETLKRRIAASLIVIERNFGEEMPITSAEIRDVSFSWVTGGYDYEAVDEFLDRAGRILAAYERAQPGYSSVPQKESDPVTSDETASVSFTVVFRGYNLKEVDRFMNRVSGTLYAYEGGRPSPLVDGSEVARKVFPISMRGYSEQEVDEILDRAADMISRFERDFRNRSATGTGF